MAMAETDDAKTADRFRFRTLAVRLQAWRDDDSDRSIALRIASGAFLIRVASAVIIYLSQVLLARWMGRFEFGIYVYVWAWVGFLGMLSPIGIAYSAQRFIPEYRTRRDHDGLRGFLRGSRWLCLAFGASAGALLAGTVMIFADKIAPYYFLPFMIASLALPIFAVSSAQDSIARAFNWIDLALVPEMGSSYGLPALVGRRAAAELLLLGARFDAARAERVGLVTAVVPDQAVLETATQAAQKLAEKPVDALTASKKLLKRTLREHLDEAGRLEVNEFAARVRSPEAREAFDAFFHKRRPDFAKLKAITQSTEAS